MKINSSINITKHRDGNYSMILNGWRSAIKSEDLEKLYNAMKKVSDSDREYAFQKYATLTLTQLRDELTRYRIYDDSIFENIATRFDSTIPVTTKLTRGLESMINFFSEFQFTPNFRFVNSFARNLKESEENAKTYVRNYFRLLDSPYSNEISDKIDSEEFGTILAALSVAEITHNVNSRLKVYFGAAGTGKTTQAMKETDNLCVVCNSSMLPADLMEDFTFDDGKAAFHPSALARCMEEGKPIVLDEINLLPFDSLRFLQGVFDGKSEFQYKGNTIHIRDGFKVIGTMNLVVNGVAFGLPEPLVDRCSEIKEFALTPEMLVGAF